MLEMKVIVLARNARAFVPDLVKSLNSQTFKDFSVLYVDDCSDSSRGVHGAWLLPKSYALRQNPKRIGPGNSLIEALHGVKDDTICVVIDGDDYLISNRALERVHELHSAGMLLTHGSYVDSDGRIGGPPDVRRGGPIPTHLRAVRAWIAKAVDPADIRGDLPGWDCAFWWACAELAGEDRTAHHDRVLSYYRLHAGNDHATEAGRAAQIAEERRAAALPRYARLERGAAVERIGVESAAAPAPVPSPGPAPGPAPGEVSFPMLGRFGRLGNQLFQIGATLQYCEKHGKKPVFPLWEYAEDFNIPADFRREIHVSGAYREPHFHHAEIPEGQTALVGYFQSWKYVEKVRKLLEPKGCNPKHLGRMTVHLRRGDYLQLPDHHPVPEDDWYLRAIEILKKQSKGALQEIHVLSDDLDYAEKFADIVRSKFDETVSVSRRSEVADLRLMISSAFHVISNSSFSWWGAYLSGSNQVVAPFKWFGPALEHDTKDLLPPDWIML